MKKVERYVKSLASCGDWVGEVCGKLLIYLIFLGAGVGEWWAAKAVGG